MQVCLAGLSADMRFDAAGLQYKGSFSSLEVVDRSCPVGALGRALVQLRPKPEEVMRSRLNGAAVPPVLLFEFVSRAGDRGEYSEASLIATATIELVYAPLLMKRLGEFAAVASELQEAQLVTLLRKYMRHANEVRHRDNIGVIWSSKAGQEALQELIASRRHLDLTVELAGVHILLPENPSSPDSAALLLQSGALRLTSD